MLDRVVWYYEFSVHFNSILRLCKNKTQFYVIVWSHFVVLAIYTIDCNIQGGRIWT